MQLDMSIRFELNSSDQNDELLLTTTDKVYVMTLCYAEFDVLRKSKYGRFYSFLSTRLRLHIILYIKMIVFFRLEQQGHQNMGFLSVKWILRQ